jgi:hypothetical protein
VYEAIVVGKFFDPPTTTVFMQPTAGSVCEEEMVSLNLVVVGYNSIQMWRVSDDDETTTKQQMYCQDG